ncbi:MAG: PKD domain-containing protein [Nitriliruptorales bacterium]|nr:PKD domain-containing protein [Nitriliruptorales bacterium]
MRIQKIMLSATAAALLISFTTLPVLAGTDTDGDGVMDIDDDDDDNDGVSDLTDIDPLDPDRCWDIDADGADDCTIGTDDFGPLPDWDPNNDGPDCDADGLVDSYDTDDDNDGRPDVDDWAPCDPEIQDEPADPNAPPLADAGGPYLVAVGDTVLLDGSASTDPEGAALTFAWSTSSGAFDDPSAVRPAFTAGDEAGIVSVQLLVDDGNGASDTTTVMVVVYDPDGGFVTGGGWIDSSPDACKDDSVCAMGVDGRANFGLVAKYHRGRATPDGSTTFVFSAGGFQFESVTYDALVVTANASRAQYWGTGAVNGTGDYRFHVWVADGQSSGDDTFRIRIWTDGETDEVTLYDNDVDRSLGGGQIVIHAGARAKN